MLRVLLSSGLAAVLAHGSSVTPVEKVTTLLEKLKSDVEEEGKAEAATYDTFACFCKDKTKFVSDAILKNQDQIDVFSANLEEDTATKDGKQTELQQTKARKEQLSTDLSDTTVALAKAQAVYNANSADLTKALSSLAGAISSLENAKKSPAPAAGLLALKRTVSDSLALAEALKLVDAGPKWHDVTTLLQQGAGVDPNDPEYKYHSQGIIQILEQLQAEFTAKKAQTDGEWASSKATFDATLANLNEQTSLALATIASLSSDIDKLTSDIASTRGSLVEEESSLEENQLYIKDLTKLCETRAIQWDQRSQLRLNELEALTQALSIIKNQVTAADTAANDRALLLQSRTSPAQANKTSAVAAKPMAVATKPSTPARPAPVAAKLAAAPGRVAAKPAKKAPSFLQLRSERTQRASVDRALAELRHEAGRLKSPVLLDLASRIEADPFGKVKGLIQQLIERLLDEATSEASKKGFCDTEVGKATVSRSFRYDAALKLNSELRQLEAKRDSLEAEISDLKDAVEALNLALSEATAARAEQKSQNEKELATAHEGLGAIKTAVLILKNFYKQAARAKAFLQASPIDVDSPGAGFTGAYHGKQEASVGIVGLLEVIQSDFERTIQSTTSAEATGSAQFVEFERTSKADIAAKSTSSELNTQDLATTNSLIDVKTKDLQTNTNLLDQAVIELEDLRPMCSDHGMSYEERVAKRDEEIAALKKAVCILDPEGLEEDCKDS